MSYDSRADTLAHIDQVRSLLNQIVKDLRRRAAVHDASKLEEPEKALFDQYTPKLRDSTYGSAQYQGYLDEMGIALEHHYAVNDHHPEHVGGSAADMTLMQLTEMLADWKAATLRHADGDLGRSIRQNATRFRYGPELEGILHQTAQALGWL